MRNSAIRNVTLSLTMLLASGIACASLLPGNSHLGATDFISGKLTSPLAGAPVYIQIFKEEGVLELYIKSDNRFRLLHSYPICKFSGGLGPKRLPGDLKSPEGFYAIDQRQLNPNSKFYRSMNIGFPNAYDRAHGYQGSYLMIHGACVSQGCYAMTDEGIKAIYQYVNSALTAGQPRVEVSIYPFRMTQANLQRHRYSSYLDFWKQLKAGYDYFVSTGLPPSVSISQGRYVVASPPSGKASFAQTHSSNQPLTEME